MTHTFFTANTIHFTGVKGVAMTSLAQCAVDMEKTVTGSDVLEDFVTQEVLNSLDIQVSELHSIPTQQPNNVDLLIYTSAHGGPHNPQVLSAREKGISTLSHAEALAQLFNEKRGIAVCGVGGKSTTSAMITWILEQCEKQPSFSVGVGKIIGMDRTGRWNEESDVFVAEADEYVTDPSALSRGEEITPRFSFMNAQTIVCTNIAHDHPDVYKTFEDTQKAYLDFFNSMKPNGLLIINGDDDQLVTLANQVSENNVNIVTVGEESGCDLHLLAYENQQEQALVTFTYDANTYTLILKIPGIFNAKNALYAIASVLNEDIQIEQAIEALSSFWSTQRRFEYKGEKHGVKYYDDYAHHPSEVEATIQASEKWFPDQEKIFVFQPHTYSRTKQLFTDFVQSFSQADTVIILDIFASAREAYDDTVTSQQLVNSIKQEFPDIRAIHISNTDELATWLKTHTKPGQIVFTLGAGDIYKVHDKI